MQNILSPFKTPHDFGRHLNYLRRHSLLILNQNLNKITVTFDVKPLLYVFYYKYKLVHQKWNKGVLPQNFYEILEENVKWVIVKLQMSFLTYDSFQLF